MRRVLVRLRRKEAKCPKALITFLWCRCLETSLLSFNSWTVALDSIRVCFTCRVVIQWCREFSRQEIQYISVHEIQPIQYVKL